MDQKTSELAKIRFIEMMMEKNKGVKNSMMKYHQRELNKVIPERKKKNQDFHIEVKPPVSMDSSTTNIRQISLLSSRSETSSNKGFAMTLGVYNKTSKAFAKNISVTIDDSEESTAPL